MLLANPDCSCKGFSKCMTSESIYGIGLIIGIDRLLDMMRTAVNVTGDATVSLVVGKSEGALDLDVFNKKVK